MVIKTFEDYAKGTSKLKRWAHAYYHKDQPIATDEEYDKLQKSLEAYEAKYPQFIITNSPTQVVGYTYFLHGL